jgi:hypothetical protein
MINKLFGTIDTSIEYAIIKTKLYGFVQKFNDVVRNEYINLESYVKNKGIPYTITFDQYGHIWVLILGDRKTLSISFIESEINEVLLTCIVEYDGESSVIISRGTNLFATVRSWTCANNRVFRLIVHGNHPA